MKVQRAAPAWFRFAGLARLTGAVVVLTPLILAAGLIAVVALTAVSLSRHAGVRMPARRRRATTLPSVLRLEASRAESSLGVIGRHAA